MECRLDQTHLASSWMALSKFLRFSEFVSSAGKWDEQERYLVNQLAVKHVFKVCEE